MNGADLNFAIGRALGSEVSGSERLAGGDISGATRLELADGRKIVAKSGPLVSVEADMLRAMAETGAPVPGVLANEGDWLAMDYVAPAGCADKWSALASTLRTLHQPTDHPYGWDADYAFGPVSIENDRSETWSAFWAERRLLSHCPHIDTGLASRLEHLCEGIDSLLPEKPLAALLHGDLWGGNIVWTRDTAFLIDPASYYGDREVDLAMLTLFDHPPESFFDTLGLDTGWRERQPLYRLWPWLVHLRLFGDSYRVPVERELSALGY